MSNADFETWIEEVYDALRQVLGGETGQTGSSRRYGVGIFAHGVSYKPEGTMGEVLFQVSRTDDLLHRMVTIGPFEWYAHADTGLIATKLLDDYNNLVPPRRREPTPE